MTDVIVAFLAIYSAVMVTVCFIGLAIISKDIQMLLRLRR